MPLSPGYGRSGAPVLAIAPYLTNLESFAVHTTPIVVHQVRNGLGRGVVDAAETDWGCLPVSETTTRAAPFSQASGEQTSHSGFPLESLW